MNTSLARRQRRRRNGGRPGGAVGPARVVAIGFPLFLFASFFMLGILAFVVTVGAYGFYSKDLPDPKKLFSDLTFSEQTVVYDRTGKVELARFGQTQREVVDVFAQLSPLLVDATTSAEDHTFWSNAGFDPVGIISAAVATATGNGRGASTITQQLVRARLLPDSAFQGSTYDRKIREIIQSIRLTQEFSGLDGKRQILIAYLNQNYYGDQSYGVAAAAHDYFGVTDLHKLTIAQAAILASIPQSPTAFDLRKNAVLQKSATDPSACPTDAKAAAKCVLVVPADSKIAVRRDFVLTQMTKFRTLTKAGDPLAIAGATVTDDQIAAAFNEPIVIQKDNGIAWRAPHFVWQVRHQLGAILCGTAHADDCPVIDTGGYQITTTLDWKMQQVAEKWVKAAAVAPNIKGGQAATAKYLKDNKTPNQAWIRNLVGRGVFNAALGAFDYRTGQVLAYVGSAGYYTTPRGKKLQPQFDVLADGWRQSGSSFKPINYITGLDDHTKTAASLYMDVVTDFGGGYAPGDADLAERGPLRMREAINLSLNIPAIKNAAEVGPDHVFAEAQKFGIKWQKPTNVAGISIGIGTLELHYADLISAYGAIANGGLLMPRTFILSIKDPNAKVIPTTIAGVSPKQVASPQAAFIMTDILAANTDPAQNPFWSLRKITDGSKRRPAALKTGTTNDQIDLAAMGYLAPPKDPKAPALVVGAWMGNSDNSIPPNGTMALESSATLWQAFLNQASHGTPIADFVKPAGIVDVKIDAHSGMLPGPYTRKTITEHFIKGTEPKEVDSTKVGVAIDQATGLLWSDVCTGPRVTKGFLDLTQVEAAFPKWQPFNKGWIARARFGSGRRGGPKHTPTAYFGFGRILPFGASWGAPFAPTKVCTPRPVTPPPGPSCDPILGCPSPSPTPSLPPPAPAAQGLQPRRRPIRRGRVALRDRGLPPPDPDSVGPPRRTLFKGG
ncbi:MAG TPA: transglycosylase domain-containing protein [Candidatus Limnocylindrales bacterium]